jgi:hypothetical protein
MPFGKFHKYGLLSLLYLRWSDRDGNSLSAYGLELWVADNHGMIVVTGFDYPQVHHLSSNYGVVAQRESACLASRMSGV